MFDHNQKFRSKSGFDVEQVNTASDEETEELDAIDTAKEFREKEDEELENETHTERWGGQSVVEFESEDFEDYDEDEYWSREKSEEFLEDAQREKP